MSYPEGVTPRDDVLKQLGRLSTPTVSNAIELFNVRGREHGFTDSTVRCIFPELGVMTGYAVTLRMSASTPPPPDGIETSFRYWKSVLDTPAPRVVVVQDADDPPGVGAFWGEVNANIHRALGCVGAVTNGSVRDLDEVKEMGFHLFAGSVAVSHAYNHIVDFGKAVRVGGLEVKPGDLIHADEHGVLLVPKDIAPRIPEAAAMIAEREREVIELARGKSFTLEELKAKVQRMRDAGKDFH